MIGLPGTENQNKIFLIDFGLSVPFVDDNDVHLPQQEHNYNTVVGTALFASINAHQGKNLSRRDDIESLVYTLIYLLTGKLPWKSINIKKKRERHEIIMYMKEEMSQNPQFRENLEIPSEIFDILIYA
jgi:serine/threonine protein kinase